MSIQTSSPLTIELCMGSSCYCRGNRTLAANLKEIISEKTWQDKVEIKGCLCREACATGPHVLVDNQPCDNRNAEGIADFLEQSFVNIATSPIPG